MSQISVQNLELMPEINKLKLLLKSLAVLDAIMSPEWEYRFYSYNSKWDSGEEMASMRNGCGDDFYVLFNTSGCFVKGFAHESSMSSWSTTNQEVWPRLLDSVPSEFSKAVKEPAFSMENISFCIWCKYNDKLWSHGVIDFVKDEDPDGSVYLLEIFDGNCETYSQFAEEYYEVEIPISAINHIYTHQPLTESVVHSLNPDISLSNLENDLIEIGYPVSNAT